MARRQAEAKQADVASDASFEGSTCPETGDSALNRTPRSARAGWKSFVWTLSWLLLPVTGCGVFPSPTLPSNFDPGSDGPVDGSTDGDGEPDTDPVVDESDVPANAYCDPVADWSADWSQLEQDVLVLVNEQRAAGADCGSAGVFESVDPLAMNSALRCAARNHSMDMFERDFFSHTNPDGDGPAARIDDAGYDGFTWGENIAWGYPTPESVIEGWMNSDGHCANIMRPFFTEIGVGYYEGNYWTQAFGGR
jgi:uncharacterized protein YkwD